VLSEPSDPRRQARRREILDCAKEVFAERGYHDASINDIISRAGIARGTFYLYFSSKQAIFESILDEALSELRSRITRINVGPGAAPPQEQLRHNLIRVMDYVLSDRALTRILLDHKQSPQAEVAERVDGFFRHVHRLIEASLQYGISMNLVRPCDSALVAAALLGAARGVVEHCLQVDPPPQVGAIVDELIAFAMRGVFIG
jgi:AcrR family transcriptional regulator